MQGVLYSLCCRFRSLRHWVYRQLWHSMSCLTHNLMSLVITSPSTPQNANHPDSTQEVPKAPIVLPNSQPIQQLSAVQAQPAHTSYISTNNVASASISSSSSNQVVPSSSSSSKHFIQTLYTTTKPIGGFRIRLYWQNGYNWQGSSRERFWCMECRGACTDNTSIQIDSCSSSTAEQKFLAIGKTIRPSSNPGLCLTSMGYSGKSNPIRLRSCNGASNQSFNELRQYGKFELQPDDNGGRCLSQHHHPKAKEAIYPENCSKSRRFDTTYWITF